MREPKFERKNSDKENIVRMTVGNVWNRRAVHTGIVRIPVCRWLHRGRTDACVVIKYWTFQAGVAPSQSCTAPRSNALALAYLCARDSSSVSFSCFLLVNRSSQPLHVNLQNDRRADCFPIFCCHIIFINFICISFLSGKYIWNFNWNISVSGFKIKHSC